MKNRDYLAYVEDMIEATDKIIRYLDTMDGLADFLQNEMAIDAVTRIILSQPNASTHPLHLPPAYCLPPPQSR